MFVFCHSFVVFVLLYLVWVFCCCCFAFKIGSPYIAQAALKLVIFFPQPLFPLLGLQSCPPHPKSCNYLYVLDFNPLSHIWHATISSHFVNYLFTRTMLFNSWKVCCFQKYLCTSKYLCTLQDVYYCPRTDKKTEIQPKRAHFLASNTNF
jgi:hypothetical protein